MQRVEDVKAVMPAICARNAAQLLTEKKEFYFRLDLSGADLRYVSLLEATSLGNSDLQPPPGASANLEGVFLTGAELSGANLRGCKGLTQEQIEQAKADSDNRPNLEGVFDTKTGKPLAWRGKASKQT